MLRFSSANINGAGAGSVKKLQDIKHHILTSNFHFFFVQELKVKSLSVAFRDIFSQPFFTVFHTHDSQGAAIIINNVLLPNSDFTINFSQSNSSSTLHQKLEILDKNDCSVKFSHVYQSPSHPTPKRLFTEINDFFPDFVLGDPNLTVHGNDFDDWLKQENSEFSGNIINFKTFQCHRRKVRITTPDAIFPQSNLIPSISVHDSNIIYSDHVRIDVFFASKLTLPTPNETPTKKLPPKYDFSSKISEITALWNKLPAQPKMHNTRQTVCKIAEIAKIRSTQIYTPKIQIPPESNEAATRQINQKFEKLAQKCNVTKNLSRVWNFVRKNSTDSSGSPNVVKIARNKQKKSFAILKLKLSRDRSLPLTQIQHDKALKVKRILARYAKYYKKLNFDQVAFTKSELLDVLAGLNTASSAGPDGTTWAAYPEKASKNWDKILFAINDHLFNAPRIKSPPWSKQARLVQVPKPDDSGKLRPISILNFLACIIDRLQQNRLDVLIHADPKLRNRFGFIRKRNCEDVVGNLMREIELDDKDNFYSCLVQLDLSSAYDLVNFANVIIALDIFLRRNKAHLKQPHLLLFVSDWCKNRRIYFENTYFSPANGLPQGAPLSTSIFVIVFNYFPTNPSSDLAKLSAYFFADDLGLKIAAKNLDLLKTTVKKVISEFKSWCEDNDMILNLGKSKILWFCSKELDIEGMIDSAESVRVLGVIFDRKLNFAAHVSSIVDYCKKYRAPLFYLRKLGLNDHLARQFVLGVRAKFCFGLYWQAKIAKTHQNTLETWWTNILRTWLGARRLLSRVFVFEAAGLPKIREFSAYLLVKRSFYQHQKNLEFYPVPSITDSIAATRQTRTRSHTFDRNVRNSTRSQTDNVDFSVWQCEHGSAAAWLTSILSENRNISQIIENSSKWPDFSVRKALKAFSTKLKFLPSKAERMALFERETPTFEPRPNAPVTTI